MTLEAEMPVKPAPLPTKSAPVIVPAVLILPAPERVDPEIVDPEAMSPPVMLVAPVMVDAPDATRSTTV